MDSFEKIFAFAEQNGGRNHDSYLVERDGKKEVVFTDRITPPYVGALPVSLDDLLVEANRRDTHAIVQSQHTERGETIITTRISLIRKGSTWEYFLKCAPVNLTPSIPVTLTRSEDMAPQSAES